MLHFGRMLRVTPVRSSAASAALIGAAGAVPVPESVIAVAAVARAAAAMRCASVASASLSSSTSAAAAAACCLVATPVLATSSRMCSTAAGAAAGSAPAPQVTLTEGKTYAGEIKDEPQKGKKGFFTFVRENETKGEFYFKVPTFYKDRVTAGEVLAALGSAGLGIVDVSTRDPDLEDVFLSLTRDVAA